MILIEPVFRFKRSETRKLLVSLHHRYPGGLDWLERRMDDIEAGRACAWRAGMHHMTLGYAIVTPKGRHRNKLSTLYVTPFARGQSVGGKLLATLIQDSQRREVDDLFVTVDENDALTGGFFTGRGFSQMPNIRSAYGARFDAAYEVSIRSSSH